MAKLILLGFLLVLLVAVAIGVSNRPKSKSSRHDTVEHQASLVARDIEAARRKPEGTLIPRSVEGDEGQYYLLESTKKGNIVTALHKRVGVDVVGWTRTETNCKTMLMRELGYTEQSPEVMKRESTKWFELVEGSSKSDLAHFVCKP